MSFALTTVPDPVPQGSAELDVNPTESSTYYKHLSIMLSNGNAVVAYSFLNGNEFHFQEFNQ
jgi:hypothetical protein